MTAIYTLGHSASLYNLGSKLRSIYLLEGLNRKVQPASKQRDQTGFFIDKLSIRNGDHSMIKKPFASPAKTVSIINRPTISPMHLQNPWVFSAFAAYENSLREEHIECRADRFSS